MDTRKRKQMAFDIDPELHTEIKVTAAKKSISVSFLMKIALNEYLRKERRIEQQEFERKASIK